jgi:hypothetical protein
MGNNTGMFLSNNFNLGIGTSTPSRRLTVHETSTVAVAMRLQTNNGNNNMDLGIAYTANDFVTGSVRGDVVLRNNNNSNVSFATSGTTIALNVNSNGNVGIGTTSPAYKLDLSNGNARLGTAVIGEMGFGGNFAAFAHSNVASTTSFALVQANNGTTYINSASGQSIFFRHNNTDQMALNAGSLGIGTISPSQKLHVVGNILASGDITAFSDQRLKSNINIIPEALAKIHKLNGYTFDVSQNEFNNSLKVSPQHTGLVAQEVLEVLPEAVHKDKEGYYSLAYGNMIGLLVQAVKELDNKYKKVISDMQEAHQKEMHELRSLLI